MYILNFVSKIFNRAIYLLLKTIEIPLVRSMEFLRDLFKVQTYLAENAIVFLVLALTIVFTGNELDLWKWVELVAVYFTFQHASISQRLEEVQRKQHKDGDDPVVDCYYKLPWYLAGKEILWLATFIHLEAWAALAGVLIMLTYYPWRMIWRKYHPVKSI